MSGYNIRLKVRTNDLHLSPRGEKEIWLNSNPDSIDLVGVTTSESEEEEEEEYQKERLDFPSSSLEPKDKEEEGVFALELGPREQVKPHDDTNIFLRQLPSDPLVHSSRIRELRDEICDLERAMKENSRDGRNYLRNYRIITSKYAISRLCTLRPQEEAIREIEEEEEEMLRIEKDNEELERGELPLPVGAMDREENDTNTLTRTALLKHIHKDKGATEKKIKGEKERRLFAFFRDEIQDAKRLFPGMNDREALRFVGEQLQELKRFCDSDLTDSPVRSVPILKGSSKFSSSVSISTTPSGKTRQTSNSKKRGSKRKAEEKKKRSSRSKNVNPKKKSKTPNSEFVLDYACIFCEDAPREVILTNCKHIVLCYACADLMRNKSPIRKITCPICRMKNPVFIRCFLS